MKMTQNLLRMYVRLWDMSMLKTYMSFSLCKVHKEYIAWTRGTAMHRVYRCMYQRIQYFNLDKCITPSYVILILNWLHTRIFLLLTTVTTMMMLAIGDNCNNNLKYLLKCRMHGSTKKTKKCLREKHISLCISIYQNKYNIIRVTVAD